MMRSGLLLALALSLLSAPAFAQEARRETVQFAAGESGATLKGEIKGYESVEYVLNAAQGQSMVVMLTTDNSSNYFNVLAPGSDTAIFIGSTSGNEFSATLPASGDYVIQVYLMRNAARRNEVANYKLDIGISGAAASGAKAAPDFADGLQGGPDYWEVAGVSGGDYLNLREAPSTKAAVVMQFANGTVLRNKGCKMVGDMRWCEVERPEDPSVHGWVAGRYLREASGTQSEAQVTQPVASTDALTAGGYNAEGNIKCSAGKDSFDKECAFGVMRSAGGAVITLTRPDTGAARVLTFSSADNAFTTDDGADLAWQRKDDNWWVSANGKEFYLIPDALIFGG